MMKPIVIIGGGPSGMMAAISAKMHHPNQKVTLLERNDKLGVKMKLTGGGRCNVTANLDVKKAIEYIPKNGKFLYSALYNFGPEQIIAFFKEVGCPLKEEDHYRMFPVSNKAIDIVNALNRRLNQLNIEVIYDAYVKDIDVTSKKIILEAQDIFYQHIIIATGGKTLPQSGSDGTGYRLAEKIGHAITKLIPAEVPLVSNDQVIADKTLQGLSFKDVKVSVYQDKKIKKSITHDLLITHFGLSGPAALRASFYCLELFEKGQDIVKVAIDFLPEVTLEQLKTSVLDDVFKQYHIPKRLIDYLKSISKDCLTALKNFEVSIYTTRGFNAAFVTNGGIDLKEVDPKTFRSKLNQHVSFCGEILDINAYTGGFNITAALSGGYQAGMHINLD